MNPDKRSSLGLKTAAGLTAIVGIVNVISAVTPSEPDRLMWLRHLFSFPVRANGHLFAALSGFVLLTLATHLLRRKRVAWFLSVGLLVISIGSHLIKGWDYEESLVSAVLLIQLLLMRSEFTARSDPPSFAQGVRVLIGALFFTLAYGTTGFFLLDNHYHINFSLPEAVWQTLAMFFTEDNGGLVAKTRFGRFFAHSIYSVGAATLSIALVMLLRPVLLRGSPASATERRQAKEIVEKYGHSSLARFTLFPDKAYFFSPSGQSLIAYTPKGRGAIALGDPIGAAAERQEVILLFQQFCHQNDWYPAFYQTLPDDLELYRSLGFKVLKIGEEGIVDLKAFSLKGKANQNLRTALNKFKKLNHAVTFYQPPISPQLLKELRSVSDEWLKMMQGSEKRFSVGWFDEAYLRECEIAVLRTEIGEVSAFANVVFEYQLNGVTLDLMRRRQVIENGSMEFLFVSMFQHYQERGFEEFNLGLSALAGVGDSQDSRRLEQGLGYLYEHLNRFYNFKGIHNFKDKFNPQWKPRYLVYPGAAALVDVAVALVRADSGDRLWDYFKPGS